MSYHASSFWHQPRPYVQSDRGAMVPGWGLSLEHAGPPMIAVGASPDGLGAAKLAIAPVASCQVTFAQEQLCAQGKIAADKCGVITSRAYDCRMASAPPVNTQPAPIVQPTDNTNMWIWITCGAIVLGAGGLFAYNKGWFGKKKAVAMTANKWLKQETYIRRMVKRGMSRKHARALYKGYVTQKIRYSQRHGNI